MKFDGLNFWIKTAKDWPPIILCKDADSQRLAGFPYRRGTFRNCITGKKAASGPRTLRIGRLLAVEKDELIQWLASRTKGGADV